MVHRYSSIIQVLRSKTKNGFVPNYSAAGAKSQDRSEEIIGSKVLLEIYKQCLTRRITMSKQPVAWVLALGVIAC